MSYVTVDVTITDTSPFQRAVDNAVVRVYSQDGRYPYTEAVTDTDGVASFLLPAGVTYQVRFYKRNMKFKNPRYMEIVEPPGTNSFDILAEPFNVPVAFDQRLCTAYGFFRDITGRPAVNVDIHFIAKFKPVLLEGAAILTERVITRTNEQGYAQIDLIRCGEYDVTVQGTENYQRLIAVPDAGNVNLPDLLFPVVQSIIFTPPIPATLAIGEEMQTVPTTYASDGRALPDNGFSDVTWSSSDVDILAVLPAGNVLTIRGVGAGIGALRATRNDTNIIRIPDTPIIGVPVEVLVTE